MFNFFRKSCLYDFSHDCYYFKLSDGAACYSLRFRNSHPALPSRVLSGPRALQDTKTSIFFKPLNFLLCLFLLHSRKFQPRRTGATCGPNSKLNTKIIESAFQLSQINYEILHSSFVVVRNDREIFSCSPVNMLD